MPLLDASLAFALTMLATATTVSVIVAALQAVAKTRQKTLREFLDLFYAHELRPVVDAELRRLRGRVDAAAARRLRGAARRLVARLRAKKGLLPPPARAAALGLDGVDEIEVFRLVEVAADDMIERLRRSSFGRRAAADLGEEAEVLFERLARRYEEFGGVVSRGFGRRMGVWSTAVAALLAFGVNIDAIYLFNSYLRDPTAAAVVAARADAVVARYEAAREWSESRPASFGEARESFAALGQEPFPIGWRVFPYGCSVAVDRRCLEWERARSKPRYALIVGGTWLLGCLSTGLLAGLGAPFWYDAVRGLATAARAFRGEAGR